MITDVSDEILNSRIGRNSGCEVESPVRNYNTKMCRWLNKWIIPLLVAFVALVALAIVAFVSFAVYLLR